MRPTLTEEHEAWRAEIREFLDTELPKEHAFNPEFDDAPEQWAIAVEFSKKIAAAFRAETTIDRRDFGVTWNAAMDTGGAYLGERVHITLTIMAVRQD